MENIPENIVTLIGEQAFDTLTETNKKIVLQHISRAEYDSLHHTATLLQQTALSPVNPVQKDRLMAHFVQHSHSRTFLWRTPIQLWKAASIVILLGAGWFLHWQTYQHKQVQYVTQLDTVYLEKEVPYKVYDTVYYKEEASVSYTSNQKKQRTPPSSGIGKQQHNTMNSRTEPERRGVSAKDDSLIQSFKFVTL